MADKIIYMRLPHPIINIVDDVVAVGLYANRAEVLRELVRNGMKNLLYGGQGGFCIDLKKMVDCCHDDECAHHEKCKIYK